MVDSRAKHREGGGKSIPRAADLEGRLCIKVEEAAMMLGISRNFAYDLVKQHKLPVVQFGKRKLIPKAALIKMLEKGAENEGTHL
jgi:excisionase family DNA binding protein